MKSYENKDGPKPATCRCDGETNDTKAYRIFMGIHLENQPLVNTGDGRVILKWIFGKPVAGMT
jgi:hypothetical protein